MARHSKCVKVASVALALAVIGMTALCVSATAPETFERRGLAERIPQMRAAAKPSLMTALPQNARLTAEAPQMELTRTFVAGQVHDDVTQARFVSPEVITMGAAAITSAEQLHKLTASFSAQLLHSPLANREVVHSLEQLHKAPPSLPSHQRQQLVLSSYRAAGQLSAQQDGHRAIASEVTATLKTTSTDASGVSEEDSSSTSYGAILSGGVIASFTVVLVFASLLLTLVLVEVCAMVSALMAHRRMLAARQTKDAVDLAEPHYDGAITDAHV